MAQSNYPLRLQKSLLEEARKLAAQDGTSVNQFINTAVAEKIAALRTLDWLRARAARGDVAKALAILDRLGSEPPREGDELADSVAEEAARYVPAARRRRRAGGAKRTPRGQAKTRR
jgi:hypothetical protein